MKMPRVKCPECERPVAAAPVAGRFGVGRVWRHDAPDRRSRHGEELVSCGGSLEIVDLPTPGHEQIAIGETETETDGGVLALF